MISSPTPPQIFDSTTAPAFDVGGPTIQFLVDGDSAAPALLRGVIAPGMLVPLHAHADPETFYMVDGELEGLVVESAQTSWSTLRPGDVYSVPPHVPHAWRNIADRPAVALIVTTQTLAGFFGEVGKPVSAAGAGHWPPDPEIIARLMTASQRLGYWNGTPQENAAVGLELAPPAD